METENKVIFRRKLFGRLPDLNTVITNVDRNDKKSVSDTEFSFVNIINDEVEPLFKRKMNK